MNQSGDPLQAVKRAAVSRRRADERFRLALLDARAAGASWGEIANALGTSRQAVSQLVKRMPSR